VSLTHTARSRQHTRHSCRALRGCPRRAASQLAQVRSGNGTWLRMHCPAQCGRAQRLRKTTSPAAEHLVPYPVKHLFASGQQNLTLYYGVLQAARHPAHVARPQAALQPGHQRNGTPEERRLTCHRHSAAAQRHCCHAAGAQPRLGAIADPLSNRPDPKPTQGLPHVALPAAMSAVRRQLAPPLVTKPINPLPPSSRGVNSESRRHAVHATAALPAVQLLR
jgi:hypothetical protein